MLKRFFEKWRAWEQAFVGIDDLQGDHVLCLEKRIARLEETVAELQSAPRDKKSA